MTHTRPVHIAADQLDGGDLVDRSINDRPDWHTISHVGLCADDPDDPCTGICVAVIFDADPDEGTWHVLYGETAYARIRS